MDVKRQFCMFYNKHKPMSSFCKRRNGNKRFKISHDL